MVKNQDTPTAKANNNQYLQPFVVAALAAIFGFGYIYFYRGDVIWALAVGSVAFLTLFWVVLRGNILKKRRQKKVSPPLLNRTSEASNKLGLWLKLAVACSALLGLPVMLNYMIDNASDPTKTNRSIRSNVPQDDEVKRVRKVKFNFWQELSNNPHPTFVDGVDAAVGTLEVPVHSMEKNWPTGPTVVTYEGTAMDAFKIHEALRSAGLPISGYSAVE